jgi:hypothetical protein
MFSTPVYLPRFMQSSLGVECSGLVRNSPTVESFARFGTARLYQTGQTHLAASPTKQSLLAATDLSNHRAFISTKYHKDNHG